MIDMMIKQAPAALEYIPIKDADIMIRKQNDINISNLTILICFTIASGLSSVCLAS